MRRWSTRCAAVTLAFIRPLTLNYLRADLGNALQCGVMRIVRFSPFQACQRADREQALGVKGANVLARTPPPTAPISRPSGRFPNAQGGTCS